MYKLLLVSDRDDVLSAFEQVGNWERIGFKPPHIRHDFEGAKDSLAKHHADGIAIAVVPEEKEKIIIYLREKFPYVPVFQAGTTREEVIKYLNELRNVLNRLRADFSADSYNESEVMLECRHDLLRNLVSGKISDPQKFYRFTRLLCSRMDTDRPCILMEMAQPDNADDLLEGRWLGSNQMMERALYHSFARDINGYHILPLVTTEGKIFVLAGPLHGQVDEDGAESTTDVIRKCTEEGIRHVKEFQGLELRITGIRVLPSLNSLCV